MTLSVCMKKWAAYIESTNKPTEIIWIIMLESLGLYIHQIFSHQFLNSYSYYVFDMCT